MATAQNEALAQRESSQLTATPWTYGRARLPPTLPGHCDEVEVGEDLLLHAAFGTAVEVFQFEATL